MGIAKNKIASVKLAAREYRLAMRAAKKMGISLSAFMARVTTKAAGEVLAECPTCGCKHARPMAAGCEAA